MQSMRYYNGYTKVYKIRFFFEHAPKSKTLLGAFFMKKKEVFTPEFKLK